MQQTIIIVMEKSGSSSHQEAKNIKMEVVLTAVLEMDFGKQQVLIDISLAMVVEKLELRKHWFSTKASHQRESKLNGLCTSLESKKGFVKGPLIRGMDQA